MPSDHRPPTGFQRTAGRLTLVAVVAGAVAGWGMRGAPQGVSSPAGVAQASGLSAPSAAWIRTELFFGMTRPDGTRIAEADWRAFLDGEVTSRFPSGLTVLRGDGRYRGADSRGIEEPTGIVLLLRPRDRADDDERRIADLTGAYIRRFSQESVLRCDSPAEAAFISGVQ